MRQRKAQDSPSGEAAGARGRTGGFTLAELLIVVGILAILIAMVMPSMTRAREQAISAACRSNLGQLWKVLHAGGGMAIPESSSWMSFVEGRGGGSVLTCPKAGGSSGGGGLLSKSGNFHEISPPVSEVFDTLESNDKIFIWLERRSFTLPCDVTVNIGVPGRHQGTSTWSGTTVRAGTVVDVYMTHFDPVGSGPAETSGSVSFGGRILGLICMESELNASDPVFGIPQTKYDPGHWGARGFETGQEIITLSPDLQTWTVDYYYSTFPGEDVRILTTPGGESSYGMNNQVRGKTSRAEQVLLLDYDKVTVDVDGEGWDDDFDALIALRHLGKVNVLFVDGSVESVYPFEIAPDSDRWRPEPEQP